MVARWWLRLRRRERAHHSEFKVALLAQRDCEFKRAGRAKSLRSHLRDAPLTDICRNCWGSRVFQTMFRHAEIAWLPRWQNLKQSA